MNRWYQIRRIRGAAFLILIGVMALLNEWRILSWDKSWPLLLILAGLLALAERAAWTADVRDQQFSQNTGQPTPPNPASGYWTGPPPPGAAQPFVQTQPPADPGRPEDPHREDR